MLKTILVVLVLLAPHWAQASNSLTLPWAEFKALYSERLKYEFEQQLGDEDPEPVYSLAEASYSISVSETSALLDISIKGSVLQGEPDPIPLFERDLAITRIIAVEGGTIIGDDDGYKLFTQDQAQFELRLSAVLAVGEDKRSRYLRFAIPAAVTNVLFVDLAQGLELIGPPGMRQADGRYYLSPATELELRFSDTTSLSADHDPNIDTFTELALEGDKYILTTTYVPNQALPASLEISYAAPLRYLDTSLKGSFVKRVEEERIQLALPHDWMSPFTLRFETDARPELGGLRLPGVLSSTGRQGEFQIAQPVEARIDVQGSGLERRIPAGRLSQRLRDSAGVDEPFLSIPADGSIDLTLQRFAAVSAPEVVLDAIHFYTSFAENGAAISVLRLELPGSAENRLQLNAIPDAEIWSLYVNAERRELYTQEQGSWIVPLPENQPVVVELTYLQKQEKLGLEGRLLVAVPETGLAARHVYVGIALAQRVELMAMESDLVPTDGLQWPRVQSFVGTPYFFEYPFYRGESIKASIFYKEPLGDAPEDAS